MQGCCNLITVVEFYPVLPAGEILDYASTASIGAVPLINLYSITDSKLLLGHFDTSSSH
jgi:hypothetical protein